MKKVWILFASALLQVVFACDKIGGGTEEKRQDAEMFASDYFEKITDPQSGVVSYLLKNDVIGKYHTQSNYFNTPSMTDDGRWLFFFTSSKETPGETVGEKQKGMLLDLVERKIYPVTKCSFACCPYLDPKEDILYYGYTPDKKYGYFYKRELLVDPSKDIKLCNFPKTFVPTTGSPIKRICTHVSLTSDKKKVFIDCRINNEFYQGMVELSTGAWERWGHTGANQVGDKAYVRDFQLNHGQICPANDDIALCAASDYDESAPSNKNHPMANDPDGTFPRIQILHKGSDGTVTMHTVPPDPRRNYATHETWSADGQWVYWCSNGIHKRNIFNGDYEMVFDTNKSYNGGAVKGDKPTHCIFSKDMKLVTYDDNSPDFYRGCRWKVSFYNIVTDKVVRIHSAIPAISEKTAESSLHPDPHPQFVCNDKYIVCTRSTNQDGEGRMHICITPVDQLIKMTSK